MSDSPSVRKVPKVPAKYVVGGVGILLLLMVGITAYVQTDVSRFKSYFGNSVAVIAAELKPNESEPNTSSLNQSDREAMLQIPLLVVQTELLQSQLDKATSQIETLSQSNEFQLSKVTFLENELKQTIDEYQRQVFTDIGALKTGVSKNEASIQSLKQSQVSKSQAQKPKKKTNVRAKPDFVLFGIVNWDGQAIARIQSNGQIRTAVLDDHIDGWKLVAFQDLDCVVVTKKATRAKLCHA